INFIFSFFFQAEDGIRDFHVTGVQTCALPIFRDVCRDVYRQGGAGELVKWWVATCFDLLQTVITERRKGSFIMSETRFIQWSGRSEERRVGKECRAGMST